jgi:putative transposase
MLTVVKGKQTKLSMTSVCCYKPGHTPRMLYATTPGWYHDRQLMDFLDHVHQVLDAPLIVVWDNLSGHHSAWTQQAIAGRDWLSVEYLPSYAPDLNPAENVWSVLKRTHLANLAALTFDELAAAARQGLRAIQRRPSLLTGFLAHAGLILDPTSQ